MSKTILILGASYAGLTVAHTLLKKTFTTLKGYKVVLVSPTTEFYWNMASVRGVVPGQLSDDKLFQEIAPALAKYPKESYEFIVGTADVVLPAAKTVTVIKANGEPQTISYDHLVVATGSRSRDADVPWKNAANSEETKAVLHKIQEQVKAAKTIAIGGGGATGVETAAELVFEYKDKEVTLYTSANELLADSLPTNIAQGAEKQIKKMGVKVVKNTKVASYKKVEDGKTELTLSKNAGDGSDEKVLVDLYLPTVGVVPNTSFLPESLVNQKGDLVVDEFLRVKNAENIWACGDVIDLEPSQIVYAEKQAAAMVKNLDLVLRDKEPVAYKTGGPRILGLSLGRSKGTGRMGNNKIPSLMIWWSKGRTLGTQNLPAYVTGSKF